MTRSDPDTADYSRAEILYGVVLPRDRSRAPNLKWVQLHLAGVNALHNHPIYTQTAIPLTTTSGVHASTVAEYALTAMLAMAHRVPRMVEWQGTRHVAADKHRWPLFVPTAVRGSTLGIIGYGSIGRELARMAKTAFDKIVLREARPGAHVDTGYRRPRHRRPRGPAAGRVVRADGCHALLERSTAS